MQLIAALDFKLLDEPLLPVAGTVDLAPFLIMIALLAVGAFGLRWRPSASGSAGRRKPRPSSRSSSAFTPAPA